jgi:hypothetical protein
MRWLKDVEATAVFGTITGSIEPHSRIITVIVKIFESFSFHFI